jgi:hypothetical protein
MKNETWEVVPRPANRNVITSRWVFKHKKDEMGRIVRFKARIVARGFSQIYGIDYLETYAPVAKLVSIRVLFAIAASLDLEIHQMDVVSAFLASKLKEKIYMELPDGFKDGDKVGLLGKSIYGLKQSARYFNRRFHDRLLHLGFIQTFADPCVYVNHTTSIIIAIWVDDILLFGARIDAIDAVKKALAEEFSMKDVGELAYFLGIQVSRGRANKTITIRQDGYVNMILEKFQMLDAKPVSIPIPHGVKLVELDTQEESSIDSKIYQSKVGSLMYAML